MKAKGIFISTLIVIDTFLGAYFYGVHSRTIKVIDPALPAVNQKPPAAEEKKVDNTPTPAPAPAAVKEKAPAKAKAKPKAKPKPKKQKSKTKEKHKRKT
ncbi:MAG: hypothetical protein H6677_14590 [Candidatus Obscuribacterales bacterium]|nr:hypothetical protein [Cyanobacteria bacterium HKST-UBA01]MCB9469490.1 hypothetical protein [Candidatus Obscuribacterales bacterium]